MKKNSVCLLACLAGCGLLLDGCRTAALEGLPAQSTKYCIEGTEKFSVLEQPQRVYVACTGLQENTDATGRLEVVANVQNRENRPLKLQVRCVFKDAKGFSTGDETSWQELALGEGDTEAVRYTAVNLLAKKFTVVVRSAAP